MLSWKEFEEFAHMGGWSEKSTTSWFVDQLAKFKFSQIGHVPPMWTWAITAFRGKVNTKEVAKFATKS